MSETTVLTVDELSDMVQACVDATSHRHVRQHLVTIPATKLLELCRIAERLAQIEALREDIGMCVKMLTAGDLSEAERWAIANTLKPLLQPVRGAGEEGR